MGSLLTETDRPSAAEETGESFPQQEPSKAEQDAALRSVLENFRTTASEQPNLEHESAQEDLRGKTATRWLRITYAGAWFLLVATQLAFMNLLLFLVGLGWLDYTDWLFHAYLVGTFAECIGVVLVITRNLFPRRDEPSKPV